MDKKDKKEVSSRQDIFKRKFKKWNEKRKLFFQKYHIYKIVLLFVMTTALVLSVVMFVNAKMTNVSTLKSNLEQKTYVYDDQQEVAGTLYSQKGTSVDLDHISDNLELAVLSSEDQDFYQHPGFSLTGISRAAVGYVINRGNIVGGGSTLTQQLAKNAYLSADQTLTRKLKELFLAIEIEKNYSKDEILEMYLNNAYFGNGVWGVEDASQKYFGKSSSDVDPSESATIAGMLTAPSQNNPIDNYDNAIQRRNTVLMLMGEEGYLSQDHVQAFQQSGLTLNDTYVDQADYRYPYYFDAVIEEAITEYGIDEEALMNNGYQIYTTLNQNHQQQMNSAYTYDGLFPSAEDGTPVESASVAIDPRTGGITALIGGRGEHTFRGYNRATQMRRQPGSTMKPFGVYVPALEDGYNITSPLKDQELSYGSDDYTPYNVDLQFSPTGEVAMYEAVAQSKNTSAVWLLDQIGIESGIRSAEKFGIDIVEEDRNLAAVALGGMSHGTTPVELASAYAGLANSGNQVEPHLITQIVDSTGEVVVDNTSPSSHRATSEEVAQDMTSMLMEVYASGTASNYQPDGYQVAGKTGTTDARFETGVTDKWLVGYTPDIVVAGWIGFDEPSDVRSLTDAHEIGEVVELELEGILPYTDGTSFGTATATTAIQSEDESSIDWDGLLESTGQTLSQVWDYVSYYGKVFYDQVSNLVYDLLQNI